MVRIRRFGVVRTANVVAAMYTVVVVVIGLPVALLVGLAGSATQFGPAVGLLAVVFVLFGALFYAVVGWVTMAIGLLLYNFVAGRIGGIEIQLENVTPPAPPPAWGPVGATPTGGGSPTTPPGP